MASFRTLAAAGGLLLAVPLCAQQTEPSTLGLQLRVSLPASGLADVAGGGSAPGLGLALQFEDDLADYYEGWRARGSLGFDAWFWGNLTQAPGKGASRVTAYNVSGEAVRMLRPGGDPVTLGPYLALGVGIYEWSYSKNDPVLGKVDYQVGHAAGTLGFGWRMSRSLDVEFKVLTGKLDPASTAVAYMAAITARF